MPPGLELERVSYDGALLTPYVKGGEIMYHLGGRALRCGV